ncbi:MAG: hypothetical protein Q9159_005984 [Coniocarpon cinnabarinum]
MGRKSRISKLRSNIQHRRWSRWRQERSLNVSAYRGSIPQNNVAVIIARRTGPNASIPGGSRQTWAVVVPQASKADLEAYRCVPLEQAQDLFEGHVLSENDLSDSHDSHDFADAHNSEDEDNVLEILNSSRFLIQRELNDLHRTSRNTTQPQRRSTGRPCQPLDRTVIHQCKCGIARGFDKALTNAAIYFRVWSTKFNAGYNARHMFQAGRRASMSPVTFGPSEPSFLRDAASRK